ncbi:MAG: acetylglutamate kinase [Desulfatibacillaceae bacterium]
MDKNVADILIESLPYIRKFHGATVVIKYGGHAMVDEGLKQDFARDVVLLKLVGMNPVIVHGGGPQINRVLDQMGIQSSYVRGMRLTDAPTMDVVEMVLCGKVGKEVVARINQEGGRAVGLSGKDGNLILAKKMRIYTQTEADKPPEIIDPGLVGEVVGVDPSIIHTLADRGFIPVIAPVGVDTEGHTYNINADLVACRVAAALHAKLVLVTDVDGVLDPDKTLVSSLDSGRARDMIDQGSIAGGMIPKVEQALDALRKGATKAHIINGRRRHAILLELFTDSGIGTELKTT